MCWVQAVYVNIDDFSLLIVPGQAIFKIHIAVLKADGS